MGRQERKSHQLCDSVSHELYDYMINCAIFWMMIQLMGWQKKKKESPTMRMCESRTLWLYETPWATHSCDYVSPQLCASHELCEYMRRLGPRTLWLYEWLYESRTVWLCESPALCESRTLWLYETLWAKHSVTMWRTIWDSKKERVTNYVTVWVTNSLTMWVTFEMTRMNRLLERVTNYMTVWVTNSVTMIQLTRWQRWRGSLKIWTLLNESSICANFFYYKPL